jgi:CRP/FNR family cyclic AMP-dependent transcriptional regulator
MSKKYPTQSDALLRCADAIVEDIWNTSDEEILAEVHEAYGDSQFFAAEAVNIFDRALLQARAIDENVAMMKASNGKGENGFNVDRNLKIRAPRLNSSADVIPRKVDPKVGFQTEGLTSLFADGGGRKVVKYRAGDVVFSQGGPADAVFYIQTGSVQLAVISEWGKEAVFSVLGADEFVGEGCLIGERKRLVSATAITKCEMVRIEKEEMLLVLRDKSDFAEIFVSRVLAKTTRLTENLIDQMFLSSEKRLARVLLSLANLNKKDNADSVITEVGPERIAELVGTTQERVKFFMKKFRNLGFIKYNEGVQEDGIEVHSSLLSVFLHDHR